MIYLLGGDADAFRQTLEALRENYPRPAFYSLMNFLSTHDTPRILTVLGAENVPESKEARSLFRLPPARRQLGLERVRLAALVLFTFPGVPTVYYGDEVGMEGWEDPFNRGVYPWGQEDSALKAYFARLARLRRDLSGFAKRSAALALDSRFPAGLCPGAGRLSADHRGQRRRCPPVPDASVARQQCP